MIVENRVRIEMHRENDRENETNEGETERKRKRENRREREGGRREKVIDAPVCMWFTYVARQDARVLVRCIRDTRTWTPRMHRCIYDPHTGSDVHVHVAAYRARALCAFNYSQRGPWGNWGMGWDKGVKIIARSSLEADRWLLHSPLHLLPSASLSLCPYPRRLPYTTYALPPRAHIH